MTDTTSTLAHDSLHAPDLPPALAVLAGAVLGGLGGYLFLSARGSRARHDLAVAATHLLDGVDAALAGWTRVQERAAAVRNAVPPARPTSSAGSVFQ